MGAAAARHDVAPVNHYGCFHRECRAAIRGLSQFQDPGAPESLRTRPGRNEVAWPASIWDKSSTKCSIATLRRVR